MMPWPAVGRPMLATGILATGIFATGTLATPGVAHATLDPVTFISQGVTVTADGSFTIELQAPEAVPIDAILRITSHEPAMTRQQVRAAIGGNPPVLLDRMEVPIADIPRTPQGALSMTINTESLDIDSSRLQIRGVGLYPMTFELTAAGEVSPPLITFVERIATNGDGSPLTIPVAVGIAVGVDAPPTRQTNDTTVITTITRARLADLVTILETAPIDVAVSLRPELIDGLALSTDSADAALLARLVAALATRHQLLSAPYVGMSPSFAVAGSQTKLFADQLRRGEDVLSARLGGVDTERSTWFVTDPIDAPGLNLLRELGVFRLIIDSGVLRRDRTVTAQGIDGRLRAVDVPTAERMPAVISDPFIQQILESPSDNPALLAHQLLSDISALQIEAEGVPNTGPSTRAVLLTISDPAAINLELLGAVMNSLANHPRLRPTGGLDLISRLDRATRDEATGSVEIPSPDTSGATALSFDIGRVTAGLTSTQSILPLDDARPARWTRLLELLADQDLSAPQRDEYITQLDGEMGDIRASVDIRSDTGTINLGGRRSKIQLVITNSSTTPLKVLVRYSSSKLDFPKNDQIEVIDAAETLLETPVIVKSSGRFQVTVQVFTADGSQELVGRTAITAQATVLTGMAQVVTVAFILILATWWFQHVRSARRQRAAATAESVGHHPSSTPAP
jgi:hypothetical protein